MQTHTVKERILSKLKRKATTTAQIAKAVKAHRSTVSRTLVELADARKITRVRQGLYAAKGVRA